MSNTQNEDPNGLQVNNQYLRPVQPEDKAAWERWMGTDSPSDHDCFTLEGFLGQQYHAQREVPAADADSLRRIVGEATAEASA